MASPRPTAAWLLLLLASVLITPTTAATSDVNGRVLPQWLSITFAVAVILLGLVECVAGFRYLRVAIPVQAFLTGAVILFIPIYGSSSASNAVYIAVGVGCAAGIVTAALSIWKAKIGLFFCGASLGVVLGIIINTAFFYKIVIHSPSIPLGIACGVLGIVFGVVALYFKKKIPMISTAVVGAFLIMYGAGSFVPGDSSFPNVFDLRSVIQNGEVPSQVYGYLAGIVILALVGWAVQAMVTAPSKAEKRDSAWEKILVGAEGTGNKKTTKGSKKGQKKKLKQRELGESLLDDSHQMEEGRGSGEAGMGASLNAPGGAAKSPKKGGAKTKKSKTGGAKKGSSWKFW